jgi:hypothetical protein
MTSFAPAELLCLRKLRLRVHAAARVAGDQRCEPALAAAVLTYFVR